MIRIKYDNELLDSILKRDGAILKGEYEKLTKRSIIKFECSCGNEGSKLFSTLNLNAGAFCINCARNIQVKKFKETNLERYGVEMPMQNKEIRNKQKEVFIKNYGVDNPFISNDFKEKYKNTSLKNYGVEHPPLFPLCKRG